MAGPKEVLNQILSILKEFSPVQKLIFSVVLLAAIGGLLSLTFTDAGKDMKVLYSGLSQEDAAEVVAKLKELRVPYELTNEGTVIKVPEEEVYDKRLLLAGEGLPRGGGVGFEIFDKTTLGATDFVQRMNYQRAMQGELARTIKQFEQVSEARVHIATPKESIFIEDARPPSASISVKLRGREKLGKDQVKAIVNLVASAVPGLTTENITVVDTAGRLLFRQEGDKDTLLSATQLEYQLKVEETLRKKIETMLEEIVGVGRALARVTADIDFSRVNVTEENYDPEGQVIRSEQLLTEEDLQGGQQPQGIPGVKGNLATFAAGEDMAGQGGESHKRNNVTRNYEVSKKIKQTQENSSIIKKLSIAVMVDGNHKKVVDKDGKAGLQYEPRNPEEMRHFANIVKKTIGFDEERGDQVEVVNMSFALSATLEPEPTIIERWTGLLDKIAMPLIYLAMAVVLMLFVIRPFFRMMAEKQTESETAAILAHQIDSKKVEEEEDMELSPRKMSDKEKIYKLAQSDPDRAADLVRRWLREA